MYVAETPEIKGKYEEVKKYLARNKEEDAGGGFVKDTPKYIYEYDAEIQRYYYAATHDKEGRPLM